MTCQEFKQLAPAMALGALDPEERAACDAHLTEPEHDGCHEELAAAMETVDAIPLALPPVRPPKELWQKISDRIELPAQAVKPARRGAPWWLAGSGWALAAAAAVILVLAHRQNTELRDRAAGAEQKVFTQTERIDQCTRTLEAVTREAKAQEEAVALMELPGTKVIAMAPQEGAAQRATAIVHTGEGRAVVVGRGLAPQTDKDYELWVIRGDEKIPAGLMHAGEDGTLTVVVERNLLSSGVDAFAISLEPAGGSSQPRGPILLVGKV
jgi:anti-sigma-K factor RskA